MPDDASNKTARPKLSPRVRRYLADTRRPLVSLIFAAPLLIVYEAGVIAFPHAARNGADVWMRNTLDAMGLGGYCLLPALTIGLLLAWHHTTHQPWRLPRWVLSGMFLESLLLGVLLLFAAHATTDWIQANPTAETLASFQASEPRVCQIAPQGVGDNARLWIAKPAASRMIARAVEYVGAGIYEEVLFRLLLLPMVLAFLATAISRKHLRVGLAVGATSFLFAAAHHVGAHGEQFSTGVFLFRFLAGVFFAMLFLRRGFGIAIGTHAVYDLIAGLGFH